MRSMCRAASAVMSRCCEVSAVGLPTAKVVFAGLLVSACSHARTAYEQPSNVGMRSSTQVAIAAAPKIELEADGLAVQPPPRMRKRSEPDDPSEPFSRNYGPAPDSDDVEPVKVPVEPLRQADARLPQLRSRVTPMSSAEQYAIMARAMAEHERRYP